MSQQSPSERPTREQLAGVYIEIVGEEKVTEAAHRGPTGPTPKEFTNPTREQLAGIYVLLDEDDNHKSAPPPSNP
jgi:hypothetical protein